MIMNVASQRSGLELPFLLNNAICRIANILEDGNMLATKVAQASDGAILYKSHQVKRGGGG
jgi:hypothetical protein